MSMLDFLKKKPSSPPFMDAPLIPVGGSTPVENVLILKQQGMSNPQIIQTLQRNYAPQQIAEAMAQAEARMSGEQYQPYQQTMPAEETPQQYTQPTAAVEDVESLINERWQALLTELKPLSEWKESVDIRMNTLTNDVNALKSELEKIHKAVFSQIQDYGTTVKDIGAELKAMEKVFSQIIPDLTTSVQDISRAAKQLKGEKPDKNKKL